MTARGLIYITFPAIARVSQRRISQGSRGPDAMTAWTHRAPPLRFGGVQLRVAFHPVSAQRERARPRPASPHPIQSWRRLRLQGGAGVAARDPRQDRTGADPRKSAGRHRDLRRRGCMEDQRPAGDRRHHGLLHADRRRSVRLRCNRRDQRDLRHLCDGRHAAFRAGAGRHADRPPPGRGDPRDPRRRRGDLREGRHSDRRRAHDRLGGTDLRARRHRTGRPGEPEAQRRCTARGRADSRQAARRRRLQRGAQERAAGHRSLRGDDRQRHATQHARAWHSARWKRFMR